MPRLLKQFRATKGKLKASDFTIVLLVMILVIFGVVMVFSASYYKSINEDGTPYSYLRKQLAFAALGCVLLYIGSIMDYHIWKKLMPFIMVGSIALLFLLFTPLGITVNGATRWISIGPVTLMPGEIAKFAVIVFVATFLADDPTRMDKFYRGPLPLLVLIIFFGALIAKQPNLSTAITVAGIIFGMAFLAGLKWRYVAILVGTGAVGLFGLSQTHTFWATRLTSFMDPFKDPLGDGFQAVQSLLALGTGGFTGLGLGKSVQKNLYLPEPQNDFILAIIGEELGFIGVMALLIVFVILVWRGFMVSMNAPDQFGMLLAGGVTLMIGIQVILNVAVVTSSMPPTGIALPFISYGGNALWIFMGSIGMLLNVARQSKTLDQNPHKEDRIQKVRIKNQKERESLA